MSAYDDNDALTDDLLAEVADLRARGGSWDATARAVGWEPALLRRALRHAPAFERYYEDAAREVRQETEAEVLLVYRTQLRDTDPGAKRKAADALAKHLAGERRDRTRLEVEKVRADVARAKLDAKKKPDEEAEPPLDATKLGPEEVHSEYEEELARRAADDRAVVWLWGGHHKIGDTEPDARTDVPLVLFGDDTIRGRQKLYWAVRFPLPGHPMFGPFPAQPQDPVPELTPEQAQQLDNLAPAVPAA